MTLSLVTVGTGTVAPSATRGSPAHWVERDGLRLLLERSSRDQLAGRMA